MPESSGLAAVKGVGKWSLVRISTRPLRTPPVKSQPAASALRAWAKPSVVVARLVSSRRSLPVTPSTWLAPLPVKFSKPSRSSFSVSRLMPSTRSVSARRQVSLPSTPP